MEKKYAIIENGIVVNIVVATADPSYMTNLLCIEVDDTVGLGYNYDGSIFTESIENNL